MPHTPEHVARGHGSAFLVDEGLEGKEDEIKRGAIAVMVVSILSAWLLADVSSAQRGMQWRGSGGWGAGGPVSPNV